MKRRLLTVLLTMFLVMLFLPVSVGAAEGWLWPLDGCKVILSNFGWRDLDGNGTLEDLHRGIDIIKLPQDSTRGMPVRAAKSGTIIISKNTCIHYDEKNNCGCNGGAGNYVVIQHADGTYSRYLHLLQSGVHGLGAVSQGETIGFVGTSGWSYGYHLHFDMCTNINDKNNTMLNPMPTNSEITIMNTYSLPNGWPSAKTTYVFDVNTRPTNAKVVTDKSSYTLGEIVTVTPSATNVKHYTYRICYETYGDATTVTSDFSGFTGTKQYTPTKPGKYIVRVSACNDAGYTDAECTFNVVEDQRDKVTFSLEGGTVIGESASHSLNSINGGRGSGHLVVYNNSGATVNTNIYGNEVAIDKSGKVIEKRNYGDTNQLKVPSGGFVLSGHSDGGDSGGSFVSGISVGDYVAYHITALTAVRYTTKDAYLLNEKTLKYGELVGDLPAPTRSNYEFDGWYSEKNGNGTKYTPDFKYWGNSDVTWYANWKPSSYTISFAPNGGDGFMTGMTVTKGKALVLPENAFIPPEGKRFKAWKIDGKEYQPGDSYTFDNIGLGNVDMAYVTANRTEVTGDTPKGVDPPILSYAVLVAKHQEHGTMLMFVNNNKLWVNASCDTRNGDSYDLNTGYLYVCDRQDNGEFLLSNPPADSDSSAFDYVRQGGKIQPESDTNNQVGYIDGYSIADDAVIFVQYNAGSSYKVISGKELCSMDVSDITCKYVLGTKSTTVKAIWEDDDSFTITFDPTGGTLEKTRKTIPIGDSIGTLPKPQREGCVFNGWYTEATGGSLVKPDTIVNGSMTLYAHWKYNVYYSLVIDGKDYGIIDRAEGEAGSEVTISSPVTNHTIHFNEVDITGLITPIGSRDIEVPIVEWNTKEDGSGTTYHAGDSYVLNETLYLYGSPCGTIDQLPSLSRDGIMLDGWWYDGNIITESSIIDFTEEVMELNAFWTKHAYIQPPTVTGAPGQTVSVPVTIRNNPGIAGATFSVSYDSSALTLDRIERGEVFSSGTFSSNLEQNVIQWYNVEDNMNTTTSGTLFTLMFKVSEDTSIGDYPVAVSLKDNEAANFSDIDSNEVEVTFTPGAVHVNGGKLIVSEKKDGMEVRVQPQTGMTWTQGFCAAYDSNGQMLDITSLTQANDQTITLSCSGSQVKTVKAFFLDDDNRPVSKELTWNAE